MNTDMPFHCWSLERLLSPEPIESTETADLSTAPLSLMERWQAAEARVRSKAIDDYNAWIHELDL